MYYKIALVIDIVNFQRGRNFNAKGTLWWQLNHILAKQPEEFETVNVSYIFSNLVSFKTVGQTTVKDDKQKFKVSRQTVERRFVTKQ